MGTISVDIQSESPKGRGERVSDACQEETRKLLRIFRAARPVRKDLTVPCSRPTPGVLRLEFTVVLQKFETPLGTALFILPAIYSSTIQLLIMVSSMLLTSRR